MGLRGSLKYRLFVPHSQVIAKLNIDALYTCNCRPNRSHKGSLRECQPAALVRTPNAFVAL